MTRVIIIALFFLTSISYGQNIVGKTFVRERNYQTCWLTFYPNNLYRLTTSAVPRFCADSGKYSIENNIISFSSFYPECLKRDQKKINNVIIAPANDFKLKLVSADVLVNVDKAGMKKKSGINSKDPDGKTWFKKDTVGIHLDIKTYEGCAK